PKHGAVLLKVMGKHTKLRETFEAEYAWINNFNLRRNSRLVHRQGRVIQTKNCSGGAKVGWLGKRPDNCLEFRDVYAYTSGTYRLTISYMCKRKSSVKICVNNKDTVLRNLHSGSRSKVADITINVSINKGYNTICFSNPKEHLPDFDKIHLNLNDIPYLMANSSANTK
ncbi:MAG TPA: hypothetical protein VI413_01725, partial [Paludibacter sp.]